MSATPAAIRVEGLTKRYGGRSVLEGVTLSVAAGEVVALLGRNGAGKTTTVEIIEGYRTADGGRVEVLGVDPAKGGPGLRARVGIMLQDGGVDPRARPLELLRMFGALHAGGADPERLLDTIGLRAVARTPYRRLSGGERQRLSLGLALVGQPELLILDEPTAGMDQEAKRMTRGLIGELRDAGLAILMTTHDLADVERLADRVAILHGGRIIADGTLAELASSGSGIATIRLRTEPGLDDAGRTSLRRAIEAWAGGRAERVVDLELSGASLEERYFALTSRDGDPDVDRDGDGVRPLRDEGTAPWERS